MKTHKLLLMLITAILLLPAMLVCKTPDIRLTKSDGKQFSSFGAWPDSTTKSTMKENHPFRISKGKPGGVSPNATDNETIRYDNGTNFNAVGSLGGVIYAAAYFPGSTMEQYAGLALENVEIYISQNPISVMLMIYGPGSTSSPGDTIYTQPVEVTANSWNMVALDSPVPITGEDLWICYKAVHDSGTYPSGIDAGSAVAGFGDMASEDGIIWVSLAAVGLNYNWNIAGYLEDGEVLCPTANAGSDATTCEVDSYTLVNASASNYSALQWMTTNGTGVFDDETTLNAVYYPSSLDYISGSVELCLFGTPNEPCTNASMDCMNLLFQASPIANAGADASLCQGSTHQLTGTAANYSQLLWVSYGTGYFDDPTILNPVYYPSPIDLLLGSVKLCLNAAPISPCATGVTDCIILTINPPLELTTTISNVSCFEGSDGVAELFVEGGTAPYQGYIEIIGPGCCDLYECFVPFSCNNCECGSFESLDPSTGTILFASLPVGEYTIKVTDANGCTSTDSIIITGPPELIVFSGGDATICENGQFTTVPVIENSGDVNWVSSGDGMFDDPTLISATYTPGTNDLANGYVGLCIEAQNTPLCESVSDCLNLYFQAAPTAFAGGNAEVCEGDSYEFLDAAAANYSQLLWLSYGTGYFDNPTNLNPVYHPSAIDLLLGSVELCLNAAPLSPCTTGVSDCITLTMQSAPTAFAGGDAEVCEGESYALLDAAAANYSQLLWLSYGTGIFDDPTILNPVYNPSSIDMLLGSVELCLNAAPVSPCATGVTDCITLAFQTQQQTVQIDPGWSGISTYLPLCNDDLATILNPVLDDLVILYNFSGIFYPAGDVFTITKWDTYSGYIGKFSNVNSLNMAGLNTADRKTSYNNTIGWNIIPVLSDQPVSVEVLFAGNNNLKLAKEIAGTGVYWPAYGINTIGNFWPGKAYLIRMSDTGRINFSLPVKEQSTIKPPDLTSIITPWGKITQTPSSHIVAFELAGKGLIENDIIGGFTNDGICSGLVKIQDPSLPIAISLNADDPYTEQKSGFTDGDLIAFRLFRPATGEIFDLEVSYKPAYDHSGQFNPNGISVVSDVKLSHTGIPNPYDHDLNIFPNPNEGTFFIEGEYDNVGITITNATGKEVYHMHLSLPAKVNITTQPKGIYFVRFDTGDRIFFKKLIIN